MCFPFSTDLKCLQNILNVGGFLNGISRLSPRATVFSCTDTCCFKFCKCYILIANKRRKMHTYVFFLFPELSHTLLPAPNKCWNFSFFFFFWLLGIWDLNFLPGIEPKCPMMEVWKSTPRLPGKSLKFFSYIKNSLGTSSGIKLYLLIVWGDSDIIMY